jgi:hypothetical protein
MPTTLAYNLPASGNSVEPGQVVLAKQLSQILRPDALLIFEKSRLASFVSCADIYNNRRPDPISEVAMTLILIIVVVILLFGGGGYYGYRRRW